MHDDYLRHFGPIRMTVLGAWGAASPFDDINYLVRFWSSRHDTDICNTILRERVRLPWSWPCARRYIRLPLLRMYAAVRGC